MSALTTHVRHFGHTTFAISRGSFSLLIDPVLIRRDLRFREATAPEWLLEQLTEFDAVLISHGHDDHLHPPSLLGLPTTVPIYFLNEDIATCSCTVLPHELLRHMGFTNLRPFDPGDTLQFPEDILVDIIRSTPSVEGEEQCCFIIETPDAIILNAVDIQDSASTREALDPYRGRVDLAFLPTGAALQFEGSWNQMDPVAAATFEQWLGAAKVAPCGGSLSLSEKPSTHTVERYPYDLADWMMAATRLLPAERLIPMRAPFQLDYQHHQLTRQRYLNLGSTVHGTYRPSSVSALVATYFTGYDPLHPTRFLGHVDSKLEEWVQAFVLIRDTIQASTIEVASLIERCDPSVNRTPAAFLLQTTLRYLVRERAYVLAARLTARIPDPTPDPIALELAFFSFAEAAIRNTVDLDEATCTFALSCLWVDRRLYHLWLAHRRMKLALTLSSQQASDALQGQIGQIRDTLRHRRPVLSMHHLRLDREFTDLVTGQAWPEDLAQILCYASATGVHFLGLTSHESLLLDMCDGSAFPDIVDALSSALDMAPVDVESAMFSLLSRLARHSVLLIEWAA